ncbi:MULTISPECIES: hypothetical protein [unclassified Mesorhizobium]|uniref:hypothetical protein n=1 Tax=unclassified Mesorhizobium TaxID=325217 RepID=UPI001CCC9750|nr:MULTISPECIES: hypothetical protein [unclassified Mesorhizobium]MBZ9701726.1 hypothetical protein [Mesorhizobium sp. CO1-1-3]MBZ9949074.1 hypothetical protein [Mesorhizobium sp. BR1-1-11]
MTSGAVLVAEDESIILLDVEHSLIEAGFEVMASTAGMMLSQPLIVTRSILPLF